MFMCAYPGVMYSVLDIFIKKNIYWHCHSDLLCFQPNVSHVVQRVEEHQLTELPCICSTELGPWCVVT